MITEGGGEYNDSKDVFLVCHNKIESSKFILID